MRWWVQGGVCCTGVLLVCAVLLSYLTLPPSEADPNPSEWDSVFTRRASRSAEGAPTESSALDRLAHARAAAWAALASPSEAFDGLDELFAAQNGTGEEGSAVGLVPEVPPSLDDLDGLVGSGGGGGGDSVGIQSFGMGGVASWGLDRIDQASGLDSRSYEPAYDGAGTHVFILDSGVYAHSQLAGRLGLGAACTANPRAPCVPGGDTADAHGHGTHVACTVAATRFGVAPRAIVHPVKVIPDDGMGDVRSVAHGLRWVAETVAAHGWEGKAVVVMSLGAPSNDYLNDAAARLVAAGVPVVVAAGNQGDDACAYSPASAPGVIAVGATNSHDALPSFSNFGPCLTLLAPGAAIESCGVAGRTAEETMSGTSMAAPHVAGVVLQLLQRAVVRADDGGDGGDGGGGGSGEVRGLTPAQVRAELLELASFVPEDARQGTPPMLLRTPSGGALGLQSIDGYGDGGAMLGGWRGVLAGRGGRWATAAVGALAALALVLTVGCMAAMHEDDDDDDDDDDDEEGGGHGGSSSGAAAKPQPQRAGAGGPAAARAGGGGRPAGML